MRNRFITWLYIGSASDWAVVLFVLSAIISCGKSIYELFYPCCNEFAYASYTCSQFPHVCASLAMRTMTVNIIIIILFIVSMGLAFMIDSVRETE